jgi:glycosyltransferase involved in cell wall biosynthesis
MRVTLVVPGQFHAFQLADQLEKHGHLRRLITTYPRYKVRQWKIAHRHILSLPGYEVLKRVAPRLAAPFDRVTQAQVASYLLFAANASLLIPGDTDLVVAWAGAAARMIRRAHRMGAMAIVERGSSHIAEQHRLLIEEHRLLGVRPPDLPDDHVTRDEREYDEADYVAIPSSFARRTFLERGFPESKLIQVPYGVDLRLFSPPEKPYDGPFRVMFCGMVCIRKGVHHLLQAFQELNIKGSELWLVGNIESSFRPLLERWKHPGIRVFGSRPQAELKRLYGQCSVFCLPSIEEGWPMVIPQAMACGLPVIVSENTSGTDLIDEGKQGYVTPIRDVAALKDRLATLAADGDLRARMGAAALARVREGFSWDRYGDRMISEYQRVLAGPSRRPMT